ncbi:hypothetical protein GUJ93_ZPchr0015g6958 [Zizania palustris]|uniref:Endonuclease/exonuclease/phosphatase domain-containing protein n=1 Tax=Zizania palustris TaxID=103762 RepID=A0A8J5T901_ZIZPA|nr:hypothetical protein GUJ93_ZPchr0015g6958 [Zizania palustris]
MSAKLKWKVLNWNIRGLHAPAKKLAVRSMLSDKSYVIYCLQETKLEHIDHSIARRIAPKRFDNFAFVPSVGASGGILVGWNSNRLTGKVLSSNEFQITIEFCSVIDNEPWRLSTIYGPCREPLRSLFLTWLSSLDINSRICWMFVGDFNLYRFQHNRNKPGGQNSLSEKFNGWISHFGLLEIPLSGRRFTWSNMQSDPLLVQLDWCITSPNWVTCFPLTSFKALDKFTSDHTPCLIQLGTKFDRSVIFRFENYWLDMPGFRKLVLDCWSNTIRVEQEPNLIVKKTRILKLAMLNWKRKCGNLEASLKACHIVLEALDSFEEFRVLSNLESLFRGLLKDRIASLLDLKNTYWKQRYTERWTCLGDENTKFFHAAATDRQRRNSLN